MIDKLLNATCYAVRSVEKRICHFSSVGNLAKSQMKGAGVRKPCKNVDRIGVRLDKDELSRLQRLAAGRRISDVIRMLILKETENL